MGVVTYTGAPGAPAAAPPAAKVRSASGGAARRGLRVQGAKRAAGAASAGDD
jgi:hypothetical protein